MAGATQTKVCIHCNQDCSAKPRVKDAQGRYACKACIDKVTAAAKTRPASPPPIKVAKPAPAVAETDDFLVGVANSVNGGSCVSCGSVLAQGAAFCTACGTNQETGEQLKTSRLKVKKEKRERSGGGGGGLSLSPLWVGLGLTALFIAMAFLAGGDEDMLLVLRGVLGIFGLAVWISIIVCAFKDGYSGWGIVAILSFIPLVGLALLYYVFAVNERPMLKSMVLTNIVATIASIFAVASSGSAL